MLSDKSTRHQHRKIRPVILHNVTLNSGNNIQSHTTHQSADLDRQTFKMFAGLIAGHVSLYTPVPLKPPCRIHLQWVRRGTAAMATFQIGLAGVSTSIFLPGLDDEDEDRAIAALDLLIAGPSDKLYTIRDRPLIITKLWPHDPIPELDQIASLRLCLAKAFFRLVGAGLSDSRETAATG
jgi:hypothetical protein